MHRVRVSGAAHRAAHTPSSAAAPRLSLFSPPRRHTPSTRSRRSSSPRAPGQRADIIGRTSSPRPIVHDNARTRRTRTPSIGSPCPVDPVTLIACACAWGPCSNTNTVRDARTGDAYSLCAATRGPSQDAATHSAPRAPLTQHMIWSVVSSGEDTTRTIRSSSVPHTSDPRATSHGRTHEPRCRSSHDRMVGSEPLALQPCCRAAPVPTHARPPHMPTPHAHPTDVLPADGHGHGGGDDEPQERVRAGHRT